MAELSVEYINSLAREDGFSIESAEKKYYDEIKGVVSAVLSGGKIRVLLLAGPSGAGKTTTANILKDAFISAGRACETLSLDDYYRNNDDADYPLFPDGSHNLECLDALHVGDIRDTISELLYGGKAQTPVFDFKTIRRKEEKRQIDVGENGLVIIEGLHALNPLLADGLEEEKLFKIFVSVSTNINDGDKRVLSGKKIRFIRRLSRDFIYRASDAQRTLSLWESVLDSENIYLYPYKDRADLMFDTFHSFELGVLKPFALAVLDGGNLNEYAETVISALGMLQSIPLEAVPQSSLIREFVSGGKYEHLY